MGKKEWLTTIIILLLLSGAGWLWFGEGGADRAPDVTFETLDGERFELADLRGHPVIVNFWATTCPSCIREMPHFVEFHERHRDEGVRFIGVAMHYDNRADVERLVERRELPYSIVHDADQSLAHAFGDVNLTPTTFIIDERGRIVQHSIGDIDMERVEQRVQRITERAAGA
ncbi:MAG: TlpA family protein disulfide reductase [Pseudomonadota bacterium]